MKRTTTTTEKFDADGKLTERVVIETVEDEATPNVAPYLPQPGITPYPNLTPGVWYSTGTGACEGPYYDNGCAGQTVTLGPGPTSGSPGTALHLVTERPA